MTQTLDAKAIADIMDRNPMLMAYDKSTDGTETWQECYIDRKTGIMLVTDSFSTKADHVADYFESRA